MKKLLIVSISLLSVIVLIVFGLTINAVIHNTPESDGVENTLTWYPEKSRFEEYKIKDDKIKFCYSIYFNNFENDTIELSLGAKLKQSELDGWFSRTDTDDEFLDGLDKNGEHLYVIFKPKEKKRVKFWFEGKYLGGKVNTNLSFPEIIPTIGYSDD